MDTYRAALTTKDHKHMKILVYKNDSLLRLHLARNINISFSIVKILATDSHFLVRYEIWKRYGDIEEIDILLRASSLYYAMRR